MHGRGGPDAPGRAYRAALLALALAGCGGPASPAPAPTPIGKASRWLWSQQGADGGWHSSRYGLLEGGQSLTPFLLVALLEREADPAAVDRAVAFLLDRLDADGALGRADPNLEDYPNYATSLAIRALRRAGRGPVDRMAAGLRRKQFTEDLGWMPEHPVYGAWGMGGPVRRPPETGHVDLSMTRHVLEALASPDPKAQVFLGRCQNSDGGFLFSPVTVGANKAGPDRSYGTATADGILALLAAGVPAGDERVDRARRWLVTHHRVDRVPGLEEDSRWGGAMLYYYLAASAEVFHRLGVREAPEGRDWRRDLVEALVRAQRPDGSWVNSDSLMKEDDPLIATRLALSALLAATRR